MRPGVNQVITPNLSPGFADPDAAKTGAIAVSDAANAVVDVYSLTGKLTATITGLNQPQGLADDASGDLYIANTGASNILVYKNDYKTLKATLADTKEFPVGVAVDAKTGVVGVTNICSAPKCTASTGSVSFYAKGKTTPCVTVSSTTFARVYFDGFDDAGKLYIDGTNSSGTPVVGVVAGECTAKTITTLTTKNAITFPGGVNVTPTDKIAIDDQSGLSVYTYNPPVKNSLGTPVSTTPLTGSSDPVTFAFTSTAKDLWTADAGLSAANEYAYPVGGKIIKTIAIASGQPIGVALTPIAAP